MTELENPIGIEEQIAFVDEWVDRLSSQDEVGEIERETIRAVLEAHGANFEIDETAAASLQKWTNEGNGPGVKTAWGEVLGDYRKWTNEYVASYEQEHGVKLPRIKHESKKTGQTTYRKNSGMLRFFYPPSQKTTVSPRMNAKHFPLRRDFAPDEASGEDTPSVSSRELHLITRYAAFSDVLDPQFPFERLKEELETRAINGRKRAQGARDEDDAKGKERFLRLVRPDTQEVYNSIQENPVLSARG